MLTRRVIDDPGELESLAPAWRELMGRSQIDELALTPTWVTTWWRTFGAGRELRVLAVHEDGNLIGLALLQRRRHLYGGWLPFSRLELLCTGEDQHEEICSPYVGILAQRGREAVASDQLALALTRGELGPWDELHLTAMVETDSILAPLQDSLRRGGMRPRAQVINASAFIALPATWDDYLAGLPSQRRYFVRRTLRDLEAWLAPDGRETLVRSSQDLERGQSILYELHRQRWQGEGRPGVFEAPRFRAFHEAVMAAFLDGRDAELELCWLERGGAPVSVLYNIVYGGRVYFYQSGRVLDAPKGVRPGIGAHLVAIRRAIADGRREYDFLEGAHLYKSQLSSEERRIVEIRALSPALTSRALETARARLWAAREHGRSLWQKLQRPPSA